MALEDTELRHVAKDLGQEWEALGTHLGFSHAQISQFRIDGTNRGIVNVIFDMLVAWRDSQPEVLNFRQKLAEALGKVERQNLADYLRQGKVGTDDKNLKLEDFNLESCQKHLRWYYQNRLCKIPLYPGDDEYIKLKDIYTKVSIVIDLPDPCEPIKVQLQSHNEIFTRKTDEGYFYTRLALSAPAGLGKTTIAAKIAFDWASNSEPSLKNISLLFVLNMKGVDHTSNLEHEILSQLFPENTKVSAEQLQNVISELGEKVVIILDAIDESDRELFDNPENCGSIVKLITGKILLSCRLLVTTRPWRLSQITRTCKEYTRLELRGFTRQDVITYIKKFFNRKEQLGDSLIEYMEQNELIAAVASVPLMALLICMFWKETQGKEIPKRIGHLYDAIISIMHDHHLSKQNQKQQPLHEQRSSSAAHVDVNTVVQQLGQLALKGLWPPQNRLVFLSSEATDVEVLQEARSIGLISIQGSPRKAPKVGRFSRTKMRTTLAQKPEKTSEFRFFHKSGQEKCAGAYLASLALDDPEEMASYLNALQNVQDALSIELILRFASGQSPEAAGKILGKLLEIFRSELKPIILQYYEETLDLKDALRIQLFIELCLRCNFEADAENKFNSLLVELFPEGRLHFLGLSVFTAIALEYFMSHIQPHFICSATLRPIPHIGDNVWPAGALFRIHQNARLTARQLSPERIQEICKEYFQKQKGDIHGYNQRIALQGPANLVAFIRMWQACEKLPPAEESNIGHFIKQLPRTKLHNLTLTGFKFSEQADLLLDNVDGGHLSHLNELRVGNAGLTGPQSERLASLLDKIALLQVIDMSYNTAGHSLAVMANTLPALKSLHKLCINHMDAPAEDLLLFADKFPEFCSNLQNLHLNGNSMNDSVAEKLAQHLPKASRMQILWIKVGDLSREYHNQLVLSLKHLTHIQQLRTYHSQYVNDLVTSVADIMDSIPDLNALILHTAFDAAPHVRSSVWKDFRSKLATATKLKRLDLSHVAITREDFEDLVLLCREKEYNMLECNVNCLPEGAKTPPDDFFVLW